MEKFTAKIIDPIGLHARPASKIVQAANTFADAGKLLCKGSEANIKSIMAIMSLGVNSGEEITIEIEGPSEKKSLETIKNVMTTEKLI